MRLVFFAFAALVLPCVAAAQPAPVMGPSVQAAVVAIVTKAYAQVKDDEDAILAARNREIAKLIGASEGRFADWIGIAPLGAQAYRDGSVGLAIQIGPGVWLQTYLGPRLEDPYRTVVSFADGALDMEMRAVVKGARVKVSGVLILKDGAPTDPFGGDGTVYFGHNHSDAALIVRFTKIECL